MAAKSPRLSVTLTEEQMAEVQRLADTSRVSCSWVVNQAIAEFLDRHADPQATLPLPMSRRDNR
jgi:predicted transcriptional regulator